MTMKKIIFLLVQIAFIASVYSQGFLKQGLTWNNTNGGSFTQYTNFTYRVNDDTAINSLNYKIIKENYPDRDSNWNTSFYAREENNKWYFRFPNNINEEKLLYDFNVNVGDTVSMYNFISKEYLYYAEVQSIDSIQLSNGEKRKRIHFYLDHEVWVEGIGSIITHLDKPCFYIYMVDIAFINLCAKQNDTILYSAYPDLNCYDTGAFTASLISIEKDNNVNIYPNPAKNDINLSSSFMIKDIEIYDIMGKRVYQTDVKDYSKIINVSTFNKGLYIAKINTEQGLISKKFVVE